MIKSFLILISFSIFLDASQQIILVVADDFTTSKAKLESFENGKIVFNTIDVNIGKKGLGWGLGLVDLKQKKQEPQKKEGDKKAPIGIFKLSSSFGYEKNLKFKIPYTQALENLICVDDSNSKKYNKIISIQKEKPKSFEYMKRNDLQYELGVVVDHNKDAVEQRGSCIFLHVEKSKDTGTAGCTAMKLEDLKNILNWLDKEKDPILIQIPKSSSSEILELYPELKSSKLLLEN